MDMYLGPSLFLTALLVGSVICDGGIYRGSYMIAHVLLNLLNQLWKRDKMRGLPIILSLFATGLINSIILKHECQILFIT